MQAHGIFALFVSLPTNDVQFEGTEYFSQSSFQFFAMQRYVPVSVVYM